MSYTINKEGRSQSEVLDNILNTIDGQTFDTKQEAEDEINSWLDSKFIYYCDIWEMAEALFSNPWDVGDSTQLWEAAYDELMQHLDIEEDEDVEDSLSSRRRKISTKRRVDSLKRKHK